MINELPHSGPNGINKTQTTYVQYGGEREMEGRGEGGRALFFGSEKKCTTRVDNKNTHQVMSIHEDACFAKLPKQGNRESAGVKHEKFYQL